MVIKTRSKELKDLTVGDLYGYGQLVIERNRNRNRMITLVRGWNYCGSAICVPDLKSYMIKRDLYEIDKKKEFIDKCVESVDINPNNENYQKYKKILLESRLW